MEIIEHKAGAIMVLQVKGRLDAATSPSMETCLLDWIRKGEKFFVLDFSPLEYISSAGLRVLLLASKKLIPVQGRIVLATLGKPIKSVLDVTGFSNIFAQFPTVEEAKKSFEML